MQSIKLDWFKTQKQKTQVMQKQKQEAEREKSDRITWSPFPSTPWKNLSVSQTLDPAVRGKN